MTKDPLLLGHDHSQGTEKNKTGAGGGAGRDIIIGKDLYSWEEQNQCHHFLFLLLKSLK